MDVNGYKDVNDGCFWEIWVENPSVDDFPVNTSTLGGSSHGSIQW